MWIPTNKRQLLGFSQTGDLGPFTVYTSVARSPVWFQKSPPQKPPSRLQIRQRLRFTLAAEAWRNLPATTRQTWKAAAAAAGLYLSGYNLWIFWQIRRDDSIIRTIEHQSKLSLIPVAP